VKSGGEEQAQPKPPSPPSTSGTSYGDTGGYADIPPSKVPPTTQEARDKYWEEKKAKQSRKKKLEDEGGFVTPPDESAKPFAFSDPETEKRFKGAKGIRDLSVVDKIKNIFVDIGHKMTREYEHLPRTKEFAQLRFDLLRLSKQKGVAADAVIRKIKAITIDLDSNDYDLFERKVILNDFQAMLEEDDSARLPFGFSKENLHTEMDRLNKAIEGNYAVIEAIEKREKVWDEAKTKYIDAMNEIGYNAEKRLNKKNYFRHQVLDYIQINNIVGTGKKLKTPTTRSFLKERKGSELDINTDYLQAEYEVMSQMLYDIEVAKTIKAIDKKYNIYDDLKAEAKQQNKGLDPDNADDVRVSWQDLIPDGYTIWYPREGNVLYLADSIPAQIAEQLVTGKLMEIGITKDMLNKVLVLGGKRRAFVVKEEVADTLNNLIRDRSDNIMVKTNRWLVNKWKIWQLVSMRRYFKYNIRNMTGDADGLFAGNPKAFKKTPQAVKELYAAYSSDKELHGDIKDWFDRGGTLSTLQANEIQEVSKLKAFVDLRVPGVKAALTGKDLNLWRQYWKAARLTTDFRESILRYAAYLDYLEQLKNSKTGKPDNYGASRPDDIDGLDDIKDKAYWLSNDLLGAYDRTSVMGQAIREHLFPFWSWKEANAKRYYQLFANAANDHKLASTVGRKLLGTTVTTPYKVYRIGKFAIKASAFLALIQVFNYMVFRDEEDDLPEDVRNKPHITLGRDKDGNVIYFTRTGALGDVLEWLDLDTSPYYVNQLMKGKMTTKEIAMEMAKKPANIVVQGMAPFYKLGAEIITRRSLFPDITKPGVIRDRGLHIARSFGLENEYIAALGKPSKGYVKSLEGLFYYKSDPLESAYWEIQTERRMFLKKKGKVYDGFFLTPKGNALYNVKQAMRYGDENAAKKYITEYLQKGGTVEGMEKSLQSMNPVIGLSTDEQNEFLEYIGADKIDKLIYSLIYYSHILSGGNLTKAIDYNKLMDDTRPRINKIKKEMKARALQP